MAQKTYAQWTAELKKEVKDRFDGKVSWKKFTTAITEWYRTPATDIFRESWKGDEDPSQFIFSYISASHLDNPIEWRKAGAKAKKSGKRAWSATKKAAQQGKDRLKIEKHKRHIKALKTSQREMLQCAKRFKLLTSLDSPKAKDSDTKAHWYYDNIEYNIEKAQSSLKHDEAEYKKKYGKKAKSNPRKRKSLYPDFQKLSDTAKETVYVSQKHSCMIRVRHHFPHRPVLWECADGRHGEAKFVPEAIRQMMDKRWGGPRKRKNTAEYTYFRVRPKKSETLEGISTSGKPKRKEFVSRSKTYWARFARPGWQDRGIWIQVMPSKSSNRSKAATQGDIEGNPRAGLFGTRGSHVLYEIHLPKKSFTIVGEKQFSSSRQTPQHWSDVKGRSNPRKRKNSGPDLLDAKWVRSYHHPEVHFSVEKDGIYASRLGKTYKLSTKRFWEWIGHDADLSEWDDSSITWMTPQEWKSLSPKVHREREFDERAHYLSEIPNPSSESFFISGGQITPIERELVKRRSTPKTRPPERVLGDKTDLVLWDKAVRLAERQGREEDYGYVMAIYKRQKPKHKFKTAQRRHIVHFNRAGKRLKRGQKGKYFALVPPDMKTSDKKWTVKSRLGERHFRTQKEGLEYIKQGGKLKKSTTTRKKTTTRKPKRKTTTKAKRPLTAYQEHVKTEMSKGKTMKQAAASWKRKK